VQANEAACSSRSDGWRRPGLSNPVTDATEHLPQQHVVTQEAAAVIDAPVALTPEVLNRRWHLALAHREELMAIARRRVACEADAEDVVSTAMLRTVESRTLDESRIGAFLCSTALRLTVDVHRDRTRQLAIGKRQASRELEDLPVDELVCDAAEARWLAAALASCPEREVQVLKARTSGLIGKAVAEHLGLTVKSAENAFTRLRSRADQLVAATLAAAGFAAALARRSAAPAAIAVPVILAGGWIILPDVDPSGDGAAPSDSVARRIAVGVPVAPAETSRLRTSSVRPSDTHPVVSQGPAAAPDGAAKPAPARRVAVRTPSGAAPGVLTGATVYAEDQPEYEHETLAQSIERCVAAFDPDNPTADPCA
jgi:RNA polymerase sigma factor (sigma-70 family)